jgi:hypothetical protein
MPKTAAPLGQRMATNVSSLLRTLTAISGAAAGRARAGRVQPWLRQSPNRTNALAQIRSPISCLISGQVDYSPGSLVSCMCAQGDILIERVGDCPTFDDVGEMGEPDVVILAYGELSGHRHFVRGRVNFVFDAAEARDIPPGLYLGHLHVMGVTARLEHDEHAPIVLQRGIYRVRRQRRFEPMDAAIVED